MDKEKEQPFLSRSGSVYTEISVNHNHGGQEVIPEEDELFSRLKQDLAEKIACNLTSTQALIEDSLKKLQAREQDIVSFYETKLESTSRKKPSSGVLRNSDSANKNEKLMAGMRSLVLKDNVKTLSNCRVVLETLAEKHCVMSLMRKGFSGLRSYKKQRSEYKTQTDQNQELVELSQKYNQQLEEIENKIKELKRETARVKREKTKFVEGVRQALETGFTMLEISSRRDSVGGDAPRSSQDKEEERNVKKPVNPPPTTSTSTKHVPSTTLPKKNHTNEEEDHIKVDKKKGLK